MAYVPSQLFSLHKFRPFEPSFGLSLRNYVRDSLHIAGLQPYAQSRRTPGALKWHVTKGRMAVKRRKAAEEADPEESRPSARKRTKTKTETKIERTSARQKKTPPVSKAKGRLRFLQMSPFPDHTAPSSQDCERVHALLTELHGKVKQPDGPNRISLDRAGCGDAPSVLDAMLRTLISGNLAMEQANKVVRSLVEVFGVTPNGIGTGSINWEKIRRAPISELENAMSVAGCHMMKGGWIKAILDQVHEENLARYEAFLKEEETGESADILGAERETTEAKRAEMAELEHHHLSLEHCHHMTKEEAMAELIRFKGVGTKTAACVILFCLRKPCFAVDTHVHRFCQWLGWVPPRADRDKTFYHCERKVPDHLKYDLHHLFIRHGQTCFKCRSSTRPGTKDWVSSPDCPLESLLDRDKITVHGNATQAREDSATKIIKKTLVLRKRDRAKKTSDAVVDVARGRGAGNSSSSPSSDGDSAYEP
jgi:endonuclease III